MAKKYKKEITNCYNQELWNFWTWIS